MLQDKQNLDLQIISLYKKGNSRVRVAKLLNISEGKVRWVLNKTKTSSNKYKKYSVDETFFEKIDSEEKAYILGLLYADGHVRKNKKEFELVLKESDKYILEQILKLMKSNHKIYKTIVKNKNYYKFVISSKKMCNDLINLGCITKKSLILKFPGSNQVPNELLHHFIRGYFDGDGSIWFDKCNNYYGISFVGTYEFLSEIAFILQVNLNIKQNNKTNNYTIAYKGNNITKRILDKLYNNSSLYLKRKYNLYLNINKKEML